MNSQVEQLACLHDSEYVCLSVCVCVYPEGINDYATIMNL